MRPMLRSLCVLSFLLLLLLAAGVAQDTYISRRELSDQLLDFLADLKKRQMQKKT